MGGKKAISPRLEGYLERDVRGQRGSLSTVPLPHSPPLATTHTWLSVPVLVRPIPRLCRPIREPCAEHGPTSQGCAGGDPGTAAVLYAHQGHPASPPTASQPQSDPSPRAALRSLFIQCLQSAHLPTHPLLLLKARGTWSPGTHWEASLEDQCWLVKSSTPSPTEGPCTVTTSLPSCQ